MTFVSRSLSRSRQLIPWHLCGTFSGIHLTEDILLEYCHSAMKQSGAALFRTFPHTTSNRLSDYQSVRTFHLSSSHVLHKKEEDLLLYFKSTFHELEGPSHCWFNKNAASVSSFDENGMVLVLIGIFSFNPTTVNQHQQIVMVEKAKMLQKRYPNLQIFGCQYCKLISSVHSQTQVVKTLAEEYANFPVLLTDKLFTEFSDGVFYLLFGGCKDFMFKYDHDVEVRVISEEIEKHGALSCSKHVKETQINGVSDLDISRGIYSCSFKNLLLHFPGCISADEHGDRIFISDTNHHRIIVSDSDGQIIDSIGSYPGYMDGSFDSAQLLRPAGSLYLADEDCLYFADCEVLEG